MNPNLMAVSMERTLARIHEHWKPRIVAELNGQQVRLSKIQGEFV